MPNQQTEVLNRELHPQAKDFAQKCIRDFAISLLLQAKMLAYRQKAEIVLSNHIKEAEELINSGKKPRRIDEFLIILGSAFFGAFMQGFITALSTTGVQIPNLIEIVVGFIGITMVFVGLRK